MKLFRRRRVFPSRPFELVAGDKLVLHVEKGRFLLVKRSGKEIDLNALRVGASEGSGEMNMRLLKHPLAFMALTSILAASYGLEGSTVEYARDHGGTVFTCVVGAPDSHDLEGDLQAA